MNETNNIAELQSEMIKKMEEIAEQYGYCSIANILLGSITGITTELKN